MKENYSLEKMREHFKIQFDKRMSYRRTGIIYSLDEEGVARIIFDDWKQSFQGVFLSDNGDCVNLFGKTLENVDIPSTSTMTVTVEDTETGAKYKADEVLVEFYKNPNPIGSHPFMALKSDSISFTTVAVFHGMRADVEIQTHMDPRLVETGRVVYLGRMSLHLTLNHCIKQAMRRESECVNSVNPTILEVSNDFLA